MTEPGGGQNPVLRKDTERNWISMYLQDKIAILLKVYHQFYSITTTIRFLGYPTRRARYTWITNKDTPKLKCKQLEKLNIAGHPYNPSI